MENIEVTSSHTKRELPRTAYLLREIAERSHISVAQIYKEVHEGRLKVLKFGSGKKPVMRVLPEDEIAWLESKRSSRAEPGVHI